MRTYGTAELVDGKWRIVAEPHVALRLKRHFGRANRNSHGFVELKATDEISRDLEWFMQRFPLVVKEPKELKKRARRFDQRTAHFDALVSGAAQPEEFDLAIPAREYQRVAASALLRAGGLLLADDLGTGKTVSAICALTSPLLRPALVVTLTHLPKQWEREIQRFAPRLRTHVIKKGTPYDVRAGAKKSKKGQLSLVEPEFPDVLIVNYHKLAGWAESLSGIVKSVVFDEVQELRSGSHTAKGAAAAYLASSVDYRLGMSATPIYNFGGEFWNVISAVRPDALGERDEFLREWCVELGNDKHQITDPNAFGSYLRESGVMLRRTRADVGRELPDLTRAVHTCDADADVLEKAEDAASELARIILSKDSGWHEKGEASRELDWRLRQATGIAKAPYVAEFVRMLCASGEKVVLYGWHRAVYELWRNRLLDLRPVFYTGEESAVQKEAAKDAFVNGRSQVMVMSLRAGAGLDGLQGMCRTVVFGELDWSPGVHEQAIGRVHRDGQKDPVAAYFLVSDSGSDPIVAATLGIKRGQLDPVIGTQTGVDPALSARSADGIKLLAERYLKAPLLERATVEEIPPPQSMPEYPDPPGLLFT